MLLYDDLANLSKENPIKVALVGAGFMGLGIAEMIASTPGMDLVAISDIQLSRADKAFQSIGASNIKEVKNIEEASKLGSEDKIITNNYRIIPRLENIDIVIEATGIPEIGAEVVYRSIINGKNIGTLNVETDVTVGHYFAKLAETAGVIYTVCTGDEPVAIREMYDFFKTLNFEIISCGKGKNNPLDVHATPFTLEETAAEKGLNPRILTEFVDGSKTMIEMCAIANSTGLSIDKRNMHGPRANIDEIANILCRREDGGILNSSGVVDYVIGDLAPGVFIVAKPKGKMADSTLKYLKIGEGPNYLFYRPYHLTSIEVPISIAYAVLYGKSSMLCLNPPTTEVITISKRDLKKGETIDYIGGYTVYGGIEKFDIAKEENLLPLGLSEGAEIIEDIPEDTPIKYNQVRVKESLLSTLRKLQDRMYE
ncbi:MAG: NAD(P)-dependent oxidoreductase [Spirochaetes bacterium]|nr:MAG: NAD(P)-dependent oxidoreductase [Spirochaetota bacterium]